MKKVLYLTAILATVLFGFSCKKNNANRADNNQQQEEGNKEQEKVTVKTGADNLVLHISFDNDNLVEKGEGVTFKENKGDASIGTGFIGKGWTNKASNNTKEAYSKFDVASGNLFKKLQDVTFTAWVKNNKDYYKGAIISLNGGKMSDGNPHDFPAFIVYLDNNNPVEIDGVSTPAQQVNGRFIFHDSQNAEQNLWLDTNDPAFAIYGNWFQLAFTYQLNQTVEVPAGEEGCIPTTKIAGTVKLYANGQFVAERTFDPNIPFNNLVTDAANALYVGAWSTYVEGHSTQSWQSYWAGSLDEIRLYSKAFTADEILALYKEEIAINLNQE